MDVNERIKALRTKMQENEISVYLVPSSDPHQNEYLPENYKTRAFISGFTGSAGTVAITKDKAILWTDGRYFLQAEKELSGSEVQLYKMGIQGFPTVNEFLNTSLKKDEKLGLDGKVVAVQMYESIQESLGEIEIITSKDLVAEIWKDRPQAVQSKAFLHTEKYSGKSTQEKIKEVRKALSEKKADATVIGALEDVCYLFNIRGRDIKCNPVITSYAIIDKSRAILFASSNQIPEEVKQHLKSQGVEVQDYNAVFDEVTKLTGTVYIDPSRTNVYLYKKIKCNVIKGLNISSSLKCIKNSTELKSFDKAMEKDGAAIVKIIKWIEENANTGVTESEVSDQLLKFRAEGEDFLEESFETIAGYGPNGAIVHYKPEPKKDAKLEPKSFILLDSGGQYIDGTTDITRTIPLGPLTDEEKENYTLVLKAHISLAMAKFKAGATGYALDTLARTPLWQKGKDYGHGTGHGVGFVLGVHEGPQSISGRQINVPMQVGMVTSNEPGIYISGKHGIRIESLTVTEPFVTTEFGEFYQFKTITLAPIETSPIVPGILSNNEIQWLNDYHKEVRKRLEPYLDKEHKEFLFEKTKEI